MEYVLALVSTFLLAFLALPHLIKLAKKLDFCDKPTNRKNHKSPTPLVGGLAMFLAFSVGYIVFVGVDDFKHASVLLGGAVILVIGLVDDWYKTKGIEFPAFPRFIIQIGAALIVFAAGIRFEGFMNPFTDVYVTLPIGFQLVLTVFWIFGVTTVINFSDGLDGLAGSLSAIPAVTMFLIALSMGQTSSAFMSILLLGAILAFLKFNIYPAKVFMGDSGANFLGFILAVISLYGAFKQATVISAFVPVLALGVPIFDNIFVVIKRFLARKPIYIADAGQIHHRLLRTGLSPVQVVTFLVLICVCLNLTSIILFLLA